jgi:hypothetical protein
MMKERMKMLKYANVAEIGDTIKAFDFEPMEGREDAYLIGKVIDKGEFYQEIEEGRKIYLCDGYTVEVTRSPGFESRVGAIMCVPFESTFDYDGRVTLFKKAGPSDDEMAAIGKAIMEAA